MTALKQMATWDKRPNETDKQYAVFTAYLLLGPERSIAKVAQKWGKSGAPSNWEAWCKLHEWVKRASDYDAQLAKDALAAVAQSNVTDEIERFRNRNRDISISCTTAGLTVIQKLKPAIEALDPSKLKPSEIAALMKAANDAIEKGQNGEAISIGADRLQESINNARKADDPVS